jgi:hypothetical protein
MPARIRYRAALFALAVTVLVGLVGYAMTAGGTATASAGVPVSATGPQAPPATVTATLPGTPETPEPSPPDEPNEPEPSESAEPTEPSDGPDCDDKKAPVTTGVAAVYEIADGAFNVTVNRTGKVLDFYLNQPGPDNTKCTFVDKSFGFIPDLPDGVTFTPPEAGKTEGSVKINYEKLKDPKKWDKTTLIFSYKCANGTVYTKTFTFRVNAGTDPPTFSQTK